MSGEDLKLSYAALSIRFIGCISTLITLGNIRGSKKSKELDKGSNMIKVKCRSTPLFIYLRFSRISFYCNNIELGLIISLAPTALAYPVDVYLIVDSSVMLGGGIPLEKALALVSLSFILLINQSTVKYRPYNPLCPRSRSISGIHILTVSILRISLSRSS